MEITFLTIYALLVCGLAMLVIFAFDDDGNPPLI